MLSFYYIHKEKTMILASHNSMSYVKPASKWLYPFRFIGRCQSKTLIDQYQSGVRVFDIRLTFDEWGNPMIAHGLMKFKVTPPEIEGVFEWMNLKAETESIWCRIINERNNHYHDFIGYCGHLKRTYPNIKFYGGLNKKTWNILFEFNNGTPNVIDKYASHNKETDPSKRERFSIDDVWPWLYAKLFNKKWKTRYATFEGYLMLDFV